MQNWKYVLYNLVAAIANMIMSVIKRLKQFMNKLLQSHSNKPTEQKEDLKSIVHKEITAHTTEVKSLASQYYGAQERDMANILQNIYSLNKDLQIALKRIETLQKGIDSLLKRKETIPPVESKGTVIPAIPKAAVYYSKMVDSMNPLGFKVYNLKKTSNGCAFKITLQNDNNGVYEIIQDEELQHEIIAAFNPLISDSSIYDTIPQNPMKIEVIEKGIVVKDNDILKITKKLKLKFE